MTNRRSSHVRRRPASTGRPLQPVKAKAPDRRRVRPHRGLAGRRRGAPLVLRTLLALGVAGYDPRDGGYSKLFAFLRSLQTTEERSSAGYLTGRALSMARLGALAGFCERQGDADSARLLGVEIMTQERRYYEHGKQILVGAVATEESQARARRAAYRTLELAGETLEPLQLRKALGKRR